MTRDDYIQHLFKTYRLVGVLADKNECQALHLRHRELEKDIVLHSFPKALDAYEILCKIRCKNLPEIYDCINVSDGQIVLEEFINGLTVAQIMETGHYRYRGAKKVLSEVCNALAVLHRYGLVHRDVKPENILIDQNGRVVLIDFNASRVVKPTNKDTVIMGTVGYASPEQLGIGGSDARTDIYALGVLFNVMLTGKHPSETIAKGKAGKIIKTCTNINPDDRYDNTRELSNKL